MSNHPISHWSEYAFICAASVLFDDVLSCVSDRDRSRCSNLVMSANVSEEHIASIFHSEKGCNIFLRNVSNHIPVILL
jgi:hypothetical protein